jgi:hypothetical protein
MARRKYCVDGYGKTKTDRKARMDEYIELSLALELDDVRIDPEGDLRKIERLDDLNDCMTKREKLAVDRKIIRVLENPNTRFSSGAKYKYWA